MSHPSNPCHKDQIKSLKRIEGQIRGVQNMIEQGRYCIDILNQIRALKNAITTVENSILKKHLHECLKESMNRKHSFDEKVGEVMELLKR